MVGNKPIKVLMCKPGLDGHDRGVKVLTLSLRDAGFEVVYTGLRQTPEAIVKAAIEEDVDVIGLSCMTGNHEVLSLEVIALLKKKGAEDKPVILGGIIPTDDIPKLNAMGVKVVFGPGSQISDIVEYMRNLVKDK